MASPIAQYLLAQNSAYPAPTLLREVAPGPVVIGGMRTCHVKMMLGPSKLGTTTSAGGVVLSNKWDNYPGLLGLASEHRWRAGRLGPST